MTTPTTTHPASQTTVAVTIDRDKLSRIAGTVAVVIVALMLLGAMNAHNMRATSRAKIDNLHARYETQRGHAHP